MSNDHSDVGAGEERETDLVDVTDDGKVELNLPQEVTEKQDRPREYIRESSGATACGVTTISQEERHRLEPPNGATLKWSRHALPLPSMGEPCGPAKGATANVGGFGADWDKMPGL